MKIQGQRGFEMSSSCQRVREVSERRMQICEKDKDTTVLH